MDVGNYQMVGSMGDNVVVLAPLNNMTPAQALVHAAWLVTCSMATASEFLEVLSEVQST